MARTARASGMGYAVFGEAPQRIRVYGPLGRVITLLRRCARRRPRQILRGSSTGREDWESGCTCRSRIAITPTIGPGKTSVAHTSSDNLSRALSGGMAAVCTCLHGQVAELLATYGQIDLIWFGSSPGGRVTTPRIW